MKNKKFYFQRILVVIALILFSTSLLYSQKRTKKDIIIESQLPQSQLKNMSTEELLEACLNYPYMADLMFAQDIPLMFKYIRDEFNGFQEIFKRSDFPEVLLSYYHNFNFEKINEFQENYERGLYMFKFCYLNVLLSQDDIVQKMANKNNIANQIYNKYKETNKPELSSFNSLITKNYVSYSLLKYLEHTDKGEHSTAKRLMEKSRSFDIYSINHQDFDDLINLIAS